MEFVKECKHHGKLTLEQVNKNTHKGVTRLRCKACQKQSHRNHYEKHKDVIREKQLAYIAKDPIAHREMKRKSCRKHWHKYREKRNEARKTFYYKNYQKELEDLKIRKAKARKELADSYIRMQLVKTFKMRSKLIPQEIIDIKRISIMIIRKKREMQNKG